MFFFLRLLQSVIKGEVTIIDLHMIISFQGVIKANFDSAKRFWAREIRRPKNK